MRFNIHGGHNPDGEKACGAIGIIKESTENRNVKDELITSLKKENNTVFDCTVNNGTSVSDVINKIVAKCNANAVDLDCGIHFNCGVNDIKGNGNTTGVEVLVYKASGEAYEAALRICKEIEKLGYKNRGVKVRTDLGYLKKTKSKALIVECCFVDDKDDVDIYNTKSMAKAIAQGILNKNINEPVPPPNPSPGEIFYRAVSGSFEVKDNANNRKIDLEKVGFTGVFLDAFVKDEKNMYRVIAGSFKDKSLAEQRIRDMASKGFSGGFIAAFRK